MIIKLRINKVAVVFIDNMINDMADNLLYSSRKEEKNRLSILVDLSKTINNAARKVQWGRHNLKALSLESGKKKPTKKQDDIQISLKYHEAIILEEILREGIETEFQHNPYHYMLFRKIADNINQLLT